MKYDNFVNMSLRAAFVGLAEELKQFLDTQPERAMAFVVPTPEGIEAACKDAAYSTGVRVNETVLYAMGCSDGRILLVQVEFQRVAQPSYLNLPLCYDAGALLKYWVEMA